MLMPFPMSKPRSEKKGEMSGRAQKGASYKGQGTTDEKPVYCGDYQKKACSHEESHQGWFFGSRLMLHHVCSACLKATNKKVYHPAASPDCPNQER